MPQDTNEHALAPVPPKGWLAKGWLAVARRRARPISDWIGQAAKDRAGQGWTTAKSSRSARRPAWE